MSGRGIVERGKQTTPDVFQTADILCLPTRLDGAPMVVAEALACGLPVISTTVSSIPSMVGSTRGRVVPPGDIRALRAALLELMENPALRTNIGIAARAWAEKHYDVRSNTHRLLELLDTTRLRHVAPRRARLDGSPAPWREHHT